VPARERLVLARRRISDGETAYYICYGQARITPAGLITDEGVE
jgi:hypothetical protein